MASVYSGIAGPTEVAFAHPYQARSASWSQCSPSDGAHASIPVCVYKPVFNSLPKVEEIGKPASGRKAQCGSDWTMMGPLQGVDQTTELALQRVNSVRSPLKEFVV